MPCAASLPKRRSELLVDFLFTEAVEWAGIFSCRSPQGPVQQDRLKPSTEPPQLMYSTVPGAVERVALSRLAPGQMRLAGPEPSLSQAPHAQGWELGLARSSGPGPLPAC